MFCPFLNPNHSISAEAEEGAALSLEGIDHVEGHDRLAAGMLGVGGSVADDVLEEDLDHTAGLLKHEFRDTLDTPSTGQTTAFPTTRASNVFAHLMHTCFPFPARRLQRE